MIKINFSCLFFNLFSVATRGFKIVGGWRFTSLGPRWLVSGTVLSHFIPPTPSKGHPILIP